MYPKSTTPSYGFKTIEALVTSLSSMSQIYQLSKLKQSTRFFLYVTHAVNIFSQSAVSTYILSWACKIVV